MSRTTQVTCDACGYEDGVDGGTNWLVVRRKKEINADLCGEGCLQAWVSLRRAELERDGDEVEVQIPLGAR